MLACSKALPTFFVYQSYRSGVENSFWFKKVISLNFHAKFSNIVVLRKSTWEYDTQTIVYHKPEYAYNTLTLIVVTTLFVFLSYIFMLHEPFFTANNLPLLVTVATFLLVD